MTNVLSSKLRRAWKRKRRIYLAVSKKEAYTRLNYVGRVKKPSMNGDHNITPKRKLSFMLVMRLYTHQWYAKILYECLAIGKWRQWPPLVHCSLPEIGLTASATRLYSRDYTHVVLHSYIRELWKIYSFGQWSKIIIS